MAVSRLSAGLAATAAALLVVGAVSAQAQTYSNGVRNVAPQTLRATTRNAHDATRNAIRQADRMRNDARLRATSTGADRRGSERDSR